jgi:hypothetical protein
MLQKKPVATMKELYHKHLAMVVHYFWLASVKLDKTCTVVTRNFWEKKTFVLELHTKNKWVCLEKVEKGGSGFRLFRIYI